MPGAQIALERVVVIESTTKTAISLKGNPPAQGWALNFPKGETGTVVEDYQPDFLSPQPPDAAPPSPSPSDTMDTGRTGTAYGPSVAHRP